MIVIQAKSASFGSKEAARITINDIPIEMKSDSSNPDQRGLHIAVIAPSTGKVELAKVFDTYKSSE